MIYLLFKPWIRLAIVLAIFSVSGVEADGLFDGLNQKDVYTLALLTALVFVP